jgi:hypothetical protein
MIPVYDVQVNYDFTREVFELITNNYNDGDKIKLKVTYVDEATTEETVREGNYVKVGNGFDCNDLRH